MRTVRLLVICLAFAAIVLAAECSPSVTEQVVGRWESTSFITTNCLVATNWDYLTRSLNLKSMGMELERVWMSASLLPTDSNRQTNLVIFACTN